MEKLDYEIVGCSGWDDGCLPDNIVADHNNTALSKGWQTPRFCNFPQYLVLRFIKGKCRVRRIQILSHHFKIATRIDVFIGSAGGKSILDDEHDSNSDLNADTSKISFMKLGYVQLSDNEVAGYKARELKTIHIDSEGDYIKIQVHKCHINPLNLYNQVGVVAVNFLGEVIETEYIIRMMGDDLRLRYGIDDIGETVSGMDIVKGLINRTQPVENEMDDLNAVFAKDEEIRNMLRAVDKAKEDAISDERYTQAKSLKTLHDLLTKIGQEIAKLEINKARAVAAEDYDNAEYLRQDIHRMKQSLHEKIKSSGFMIDNYGAVVPMPQRPPAKSISRPPPPSMYDGNEKVIDLPREELDALRELESSTKVNPVIPNDPHEKGSSSRPRTSPKLGGAPPPGQLEPIPEYIPNKAKSSTDISSSSRPARSEPSRPPKIGTQSQRIGEMEDETYDTDRPEPSKSPPIPTLAKKKGKIFEENMEEEYEEERPAPKKKPAAKPSTIKKKPVEEEEQEEIETFEQDMDTIRPKSISPFQPDLADGVLVPFPEGAEDPEPLSTRDEDDYAVPIQVFGPLLIRCSLSKSFKLREWAFSEVGAQVERFLNSGNKVNSAEMENFTKAVLLIVEKGINDTREKVATASLSLWEMITKLSVRDKVNPASFFKYFDSMVPKLLQRASDTNPRTKQYAENLVSMLCQQFVSQPFSVLTMLLRPFPKKPAMPLWKHVKARVDAICRCIVEIGIEDTDRDATKNSGFNVDSIMTFIVPHFGHSSGEVRDACTDVTIELAKKVGRNNVEPYLKNLKSQLLSSIQTKLSAVQRANFGGSLGGKNQKQQEQQQQQQQQSPPAASGKNAGNVRKSKEDLSAKKKQGPITAKTNTKKAGAGTLSEEEKEMVSDLKKKKNAKDAQGPKSPRSPTSDKKFEFTNNDWNIDRTCIFCDEKNELFNEENLDAHYWRDCPMLTNCPFCQMIVEIAVLNEHLISECENRNMFRRCPTCREPVFAKDFEAHIKSQACEPGKPSPEWFRCPLCHDDIPGRDRGFKGHLLVGAGCPQNPRKPLHLRGNGNSGIATVPRGQQYLKNRVGERLEDIEEISSMPQSPKSQGFYGVGSPMSNRSQPGSPYMSGGESDYGEGEKKKKKGGWKALFGFGKKDENAE